MSTAPESKLSSSKLSDTTPLPGGLSKEQLIDQIIRVDHAGERGAINIYKGQLAVLGKNPAIREKLQEMLENEEYHLETFDRLMVERRARPTALQPVWDKFAYYVLGVGTALMGEKAAMACTDAVEEVIGRHYAQQAEQLNEDEADLKKIILEFRDDELGHQTTAIEHGAREAPFYGLLSRGIKTCCHIAIGLSKRV